MRFRAVVRATLDVVLMSVFTLGLVVLAGCGSSSSGGGGGTTTPTGKLATGGAASIYAIQATGGTGGGASILGFSADTSGSLSPTSTLVMPSTVGSSAVAIDGSGQIYVGGYSTTSDDAEILVFAAGATGTATPVRTILVDANDEILISSITVDASGQIYVAGAEATGLVEVFPAGANGTVTPARVLSSTSLYEPIDITVDTGGKIYVSNIGLTAGQVLVFAADANGSDDPVETISTVAATSTSEAIFYGIAVDASGNIFVVQDSATFDTQGNETSASGAIEEFAPGATGTPTPTKTITGSSVGFTYAGGLSLDGVGNAYLIGAATVDNATVFTLLGFGPEATGNVAPGVSITSSALNDALSQIAVH